MEFILFQEKEYFFMKHLIDIGDRTFEFDVSVKIRNLSDHAIVTGFNESAYSTRYF